MTGRASATLVRHASFDEADCAPRPAHFRARRARRRCPRILGQIAVWSNDAAVIRGFKSRALQWFFEKNDARRLQRRQLAKIARIMSALDSGIPLKQLGAYRGFRLHELTGSDKGVWTVRVTGNRRITFRVDEHGNAYDVDLVDYH